MKIFMINRILVNMIIRGWNDVIDSSNTPPAPPMAKLHPRGNHLFSVAAFSVFVSNS